MSDYTHCPKCGHQTLSVEISASATLAFQEGDPDGQVESYDELEWDRMSLTTCQSCFFTAELLNFQFYEPYRRGPAPAWRLLQPDEPIVKGVRVVTLRGEQDLDCEGKERRTPPLSVGEIAGVNCADTWDLVFPNGAWVCPSENELRDPAQYILFTEA